MDEVQGFFDVHRALGTWPGGLHVELHRRQRHRVRGRRRGPARGRPGQLLRVGVRPAAQPRAVAGAGVPGGRDALRGPRPDRGLSGPGGPGGPRPARPRTAYGDQDPEQRWQGPADQFVATPGTSSSSSQAETIATGGTSRIHGTTAAAGLLAEQGVEDAVAHERGQPGGVERGQRRLQAEGRQAVGHRGGAVEQRARGRERRHGHHERRPDRQGEAARPPRTPRERTLPSSQLSAAPRHSSRAAPGHVAPATQPDHEQADGGTDADADQGAPVSAARAAPRPRSRR